MVIGLLLFGSAVQLSPWKLEVQEIAYDGKAARLCRQWVATTQKTGLDDGLRNDPTWDELMSMVERRWPHRGAFRAPVDCGKVIVLQRKTVVDGV